MFQNKKVKFDIHVKRHFKVFEMERKIYKLKRLYKYIIV